MMSVPGALAAYVESVMRGVTGLMKWPVTVAGAAISWLAQPQEHNSQPLLPQENVPRDGCQSGTAQSAEPASIGRGAVPVGVSDALTKRYGAGDKLPVTHFPVSSHATKRVREQPAKVGDLATASALRQVARASVHRNQHPD